MAGGPGEETKRRVVLRGPHPAVDSATSCPARPESPRVLCSLSLSIRSRHPGVSAEVLLHRETRRDLGFIASEPPREKSPRKTVYMSRLPQPRKEIEY